MPSDSESLKLYWTLPGGLNTAEGAEAEVGRGAGRSQELRGDDIVKDDCVSGVSPCLFFWKRKEGVVGLLAVLTVNVVGLMYKEGTRD